MNINNSRKTGASDHLMIAKLVIKYRKRGPFRANDPLLDKLQSKEAKKFALKLTRQMSNQELIEAGNEYFIVPHVRERVMEATCGLQTSPGVRNFIVSILTSRVMARKDDFLDLDNPEGKTLTQVIKEEKNKLIKGS